MAASLTDHWGSVIRRLLLLAFVTFAIAAAATLIVTDLFARYNSCQMRHVPAHCERTVRHDG